MRWQTNQQKNMRKRNKQTKNRNKKTFISTEVNVSNGTNLYILSSMREMDVEFVLVYFSVTGGGVRPDF